MRDNDNEHRGYGLAIHSYEGTPYLLPSTLNLQTTFVLIDCPFYGLDTINLGGVAELQFGPTASNFFDANVPSQVSLSMVTLSGNSTLRLRPSVNGDADSSILQLTIGSLQIGPNASLNADGMGYPMTLGPLSGPLGPLGIGTGGGHAGRSNRADHANNPYGYGEARTPNKAGSGGYPGTTDVRIAGAGGGVVSLVVTQSLVLDGRISANGQSQGFDYLGNPSPLLSGAGGSVLLQFNTISGTGSVSADGFDGGASGGRVALFGSLTTATIQVTAAAHNQGGACGTVYKANRDTAEEVLEITNTVNAALPTFVGLESLKNATYTLKLINSPPFYIGYGIAIDIAKINFVGGFNSSVYVAGVLTGFAASKFSGLTVYQTGNVTIQDTSLTANSNFTFDIDGTISNIDSITVDTGIVARLGSFATISGSSSFVVDKYDIKGNLWLYGSDALGACLTLKTSSISISSSGVLNATGFSAGLGPSPYVPDESWASHASYSCYSGGPYNENKPVGDFMLPTLMGSGGPPAYASGGKTYHPVSGGNVWIIAETVTNNGLISVDGQLGGAAGSILIQSQTYEGTGTLSASSIYQTTEYGPCTADGRIALYYNGTGPNANFYQTVTAGTYYEKDYATNTSLVYLNQDPQGPAPYLIPPASSPSTPFVTSIYFNGYGYIVTPIHAKDVTSINSALLSGIVVVDVLTLQTDSVLCSLAQGGNCTIVNYAQIKIATVAIGSLLIHSVLQNYGFITGGNINVTGQLYLSVQFGTPELFSNGTADGYVPGAVLVNNITVSPGGQIIFNRILEDRNPAPSKRFDFITAPHAYIQAFDTILVDGGVITSDAEGGYVDYQTTSCVGGGSFGPGGGDAAGAYVDDDNLNPTKMGLGPTNCTGIYKSGTNQLFGGGALQMATRRLILQNGARISASGMLGGGGGSVWIQAPLILSDSSSGLFSNGSTYPSHPVCGSGGRIAVYSLKNITAGIDISVDVSGADCPYTVQPSNGNFVGMASPFYFILQTLVFYNLPTASGSHDFIRFNQVGIMGSGTLITSYFMPDNYKYNVIANATVEMDSYPPYLGSVKIRMQAAGDTMAVTITFFSDWFEHNPTCEALDVSFRLYNPSGPAYIPAIYSSDSPDGNVYYIWNNSNSDPTLKLTLLSTQILIDGIAQFSTISVDSSSVHVHIPVFYENATYSFVARHLTHPTSPPIGNPCLVNNGGCDQRVTCTDAGNGNRNCGPCPKGTSGYGDFLCVVLCGDKKCNATIGENCVSCPLDCNATTPCGACGDSVCDLNEDCGKCPSDCGTCSKPKSCDKNCNHGKCVTGKCVCDSSWSGPYCNFPPSQPVNSTLNATNPGIILDSPTAHFSISIKRIAETDGYADLRTVDIANIVFMKAEVVNGKNIISNYSASLGNGASLNVIVSQFEESSTPYTFAGTTTTYPAHTIKLNINVQNWPFLALANSLKVIFDAKNANSNSKSTTCTNDEDNTGNLQWLLLVVDQTSLYVQFLDSALVDGRVRKISFSFNSSDQTVSAILPHFWEFSEMDPSYNVLLGDVSADEACTGVKTKNKSVSKKVIIAVVVPVVVLILLVVLFLIFVLPRLKTWMKVRHSTRVPSHNPDTELDHMQIERTKEYSVNSAAGNFRLEL
eukprot:Phypoly_transcript_00327.p1 GENE.Phypoly_transcript_00327~~Phypoly_transcript_00327.p1  ORF type:complete len:1631 (+),score=195.10 Phypoly_transcript_00327:260-5152(+)